MKYLCIENSGEVDHRAFTLLGASVKGDDAIGMFGSGTKYSIATLLRNKVALRIFSGEDEIVIGTKATKFRDNDFEVITINGQETSLTTATGLKWRVDQCVREFVSNAIDEGGCLTSEVVACYGKTGKTCIFIEMTPRVEAMWEEWDKYFLSPEAKPICEGYGNEVYFVEATGNAPSIMRRGVWCVEEFGDAELLFSYNFRDVNLPETRLTHPTVVVYETGMLLRSLVDSTAIDLMIEQAGNTNCFEWRCLSYASNPVSKPFIAKIELRFDWIAMERDINHFPPNLRSRVLVCSQAAFNVLRVSGMKDIKAFRNSDFIYTELSWPIAYSDRVHAVIAKLNKNGIDISFPIKYVRFSEGQDHIAVADMRNGQCLLTQRAFENPSDIMLTKALIEEWTHLKYAVADFTPQQQHVYLDTIVSLLR